MRIDKKVIKIIMQISDLLIGSWRAQAQIHDVGNGKLMAVISATDESGSGTAGTRHTVVFDHNKQRDTIDETKVLMRRLLQDRYGS